MSLPEAYNLIKSLYGYRTIFSGLIFILFLVSFFSFFSDLYDRLLMNYLGHYLEFIQDNPLLICKLSITIGLMLLCLLDFIFLFVPIFKMGLATKHIASKARAWNALLEEGLNILNVANNDEQTEKIKNWVDKFKQDDYFLSKYPKFLVSANPWLTFDPISDFKSKIDIIRTAIRELVSVT